MTWDEFGGDYFSAVLPFGFNLHFGQMKVLAFLISVKVMFLSNMKILFCVEHSAVSWCIVEYLLAVQII